MCTVIHFALLVLVSALGMQAGRVVLERALQDQVSGATGFVYQTDINGPTSYVQYSTGHGPGTTHLGYPPLTLGHVELQQQLPTVPLASLYPAAVAPLQYHEPLIQSLPVQDVQRYGVHDGRGEGEASGFSKGGGSESNSGHQSASGEKEEKGYKSGHDYSKGNEGKHSEDGQKGHYNKTGGNKKSNHDIAGHYNEHQSSGEGDKGGSFSEANSHKKGSKTTGYHKIYHKDEYKKDHTFYDESDSSGHFDKYGGNHAEHSGEEGGHKKGGHSDSGFSKGDKGQSGYYDKGAYNKQDSGHKGAEGGDKYNANKSDFSKNEEESDGKEYGYSDGHEGGGHDKN